ncbi:ATP-binding protein [Candidatus Woesearchaeota archaeon]|nr:ATP-binding protein [Candidatus Woesearchaeota archaeon]
MAYQIPQQLEYKEKIMFGLTFKQLAYAFVFGSIGLIFFNKVSNDYLKYTLALIPSILGIGFMFLDLDVLIKNYWTYMKFRKIQAGNPKLEAFLSVKSIEDNVIINSQNKKIAVLNVMPINFSIKPRGEQEAIMESFQKFLNSIEFPVQILMNTETLELDDYLKSLRSRVNEDTFKDLFEKYKKHLKDTIVSNKIMNRIFYLVIPESSNLDIQVNICMERLESMNLKVERLSTKQLKKLLTQFFQGNGKGKLIESLLPEYISNNSNHIETNKKFYRIINAFGYPRMVEPGFLDRVVSSLGDYDLSIHVKPYPIETMLIDLNKELQKQRADLYAMQSKDIINPSLEIQYNDTRKTLEELQKGEEKLFNISLYINCKASSLVELELLSRKVMAELNSLMIIPKTPQFRMLQGLKSTAPLGIDELNVNRNITTKPLSAFFPFTSQFSQVDETGVWLGLNRNKIPIIRDIFMLPNPNGLVLAQSGGGKSYFCKLLVTRYLLNGTKVMIVDPQGEYRELVRYFKGQRIDLSRTSKTIINPLDLMGHDYAEKRLSLMDLMQVILGELTEPQKAFIDRALTQAYEKKGISEDPATWEYEPPILADVQTALYSMEKKAIQLEKSTIRSLINRLSMYVDGVFSFLNQHTNIDFSNRFVCFDIGNMPKQVKPVVMFLVLDYVYMKMKKDIERKILLIDEAWSLLSRTEDATYIFEIVKTCRKFNLGLLLINQEVEGLLNSEAGKSVLANSAYTLLMRQKPAVIKDVCSTFHLSSSERTFLLTANVGEGILIMEDDHSEIKVVASAEEHRIITTNADELIAQKVPAKSTTKKPSKKAQNAKPKLTQKSKIRVSIDVDEFKGFYRHKDLSLPEIKYLLAKKYQEIERASLANPKKEKYLIKPRFNESMNHCFTTHDIADYLESNGIKPKLFVTKKPDITFEIGKTKYAIEIETGITISKAKNQLMEKVKLLNQDYDEWFFVVLDRNFLKKYRALGRVIDKRYLKNQLDKLLKISTEKSMVGKQVSRREKEAKNKE